MLVITIIVIVILAVAVIQSIANNNPIENANKAKFQNDIKSMQEELELIKAKNYAESNGANYGTTEFTDLAGANKYDGKFKVVDGELVYTSALQGNELIWAQELGIKEVEYSFAFTGEGSDYGVEDIDFDFEDHVAGSGNGTKKAAKIIKNNKTNKYTSLVITEDSILYYLDGFDYATEDSAFLSLEKDDSWKNSEYLEFPGIVNSFSYYLGINIKAKKVKFAEGITEIRGNSFVSVESLEEVELPNTLEYADGFKSCLNLKSVTIPKNVKSFYFMGCSSLATITISRDVQNLSIPEAALDMTAVNKIYIPKGVIEIGSNSFWRNY